MRTSLLRLALVAGAVSAFGFALGYAGEAAALDRQKAVGGVAGSAPRGYGAERPRAGAERTGYGAERDYYGASNLRAVSGHDRGYDEGYRSHGSIVEFEDGYAEDGREGTLEGDGGSRVDVYPGFGGSSFIYLGDQAASFDAAQPQALPSGPRIIDVEAERLDRRPVAKDTVEVSFVGGAKIIRIGAGTAGRSGPPRQEARPALAPWSEPWQRYCSRAYPTFDVERGTYTEADGSTRFCTGG